MVWYGMVWYGMVWYGMVWYGMVSYGMVIARSSKQMQMVTFFARIVKGQLEMSSVKLNRTALTNRMM